MDPNDTHTQDVPAGQVQQPMAMPPIASVPQQPVAQTAMPALTNDNAIAGLKSPTPLEAADNDVIEPEWITRAKQIVAETHDDPYKQVREIHKLRADYMQKRYKKELKLPDA